MNAPYSPNEPKRRARLSQYDILDTPKEEIFEEITRVAAFICAAPIAFISLIDDERQWFKSIVGIELAQVPRGLSFCTHTILQSDVMIVADAVRDDRFQDNPFVTGEPHVRFYAGMPLVTPDGYALGTLCVLDRKPRTLTEDQQLTLRVLARQVVAHLELKRHEAIQVQLVAECEHLLAESLERADRDPLTNVLNHRVFQNHLDYEAGRALQTNSTLAVIVLDLDNFRFFNDVYGHSTGDGVLLSVAQRLTKIGRYDVLARYGGDEFALLLRDVGNATRQEIEAAVHADLQHLSYRPEGQAAAIPITVSCGVALYPYGTLDRHEVVQRAEERLHRAKTGGGGEPEEVRTAMLTSLSGFSMLDALVTAVDNKDRYTRRHSDDVMTYSLMIARALNLSEAMLHTISVAALLHDVGKIGVPDHILRKPGKLTDDEYEAVKQHPQMGAIMVSSVPGLEQTLDAVRHHHERWDGEGYPFGLRGEETPLIARLMAVADAYSAMTTDRPYRRGMEPARALAILNSGAGTQWDPGCVDAFLRAQRDETHIQPLRAA